MRLTLRNLLAYLNGLLQASDEETLREKIAQGGRAQDLAERIPRLVRQPTLDAPRVDSRATGGDANTVAEYLDGLLPPEKAAEFDRNCLQSDRQLAEVASSFEILSFAQRKPIRADSRLRQRLYRLSEAHGLGEGEPDRGQGPHRDQPGPAASTHEVDAATASTASASAASTSTTAASVLADEKLTSNEQVADEPIPDQQRARLLEEALHGETQGLAATANPEALDRDAHQSRPSVPPDAMSTRDADEPPAPPVAPDPSLPIPPPPPGDSSEPAAPPRPAEENWFEHADVEQFLRQQAAADSAADSAADAAADPNVAHPPQAEAAFDSTQATAATEATGLQEDSLGQQAAEQERPPTGAIEATPSDALASETSLDVKTVESRLRQAEPKTWRQRLPLAFVTAVGLCAVLAAGGWLFNDAGKSSIDADNATQLADNATVPAVIDDDQSPGARPDERVGTGESEAAGNGNARSNELSESDNLEPPRASVTGLEPLAEADDADAPQEDAQTPPFALADEDDRRRSNLELAPPRRDAGGAGSPEDAAPAGERLQLPRLDPDQKSGLPIADVPLEELEEEVAADEFAKAMAEIDPNDPPRVGGPAVGKLLGRNHLVARFDETRFDESRGGWFRLPLEGELYLYDQILNFPFYETPLKLGPALQVTLLGASGFELHGRRDNLPQLELRFGTALFAAGGQREVEFELAIDDQLLAVNLADDDARMVVRRFTYLPPGTDPRSTSASVIIDAIVLQGRVGWTIAGEPRIFEAGQAIRWIDGVPGEVRQLSTIPYWVDQSITDIDRRGGETVAERIADETALETAFLSLVEDSRVEVRMLSVQALSLLGNHEPAIAALANQRNKIYWSDLVAWLRGAAARGPDHAAALAEMFQFVAPETGELAYRLLLGYSEEQVAAGAAGRLVDLLESDDLLVRVLAIANLQQITGTRGLYRPETSEKIREGHVRTWRRQLEKGHVRYSAPPRPPSINGQRMGE